MFIPALFEVNKNEKQPKCPSIGEWISKLWYSYTEKYNSAIKMNSLSDFPGGVVFKNPPASAGDTGSIPGPGRSHMPQSN